MMAVTFGWWMADSSRRRVVALVAAAFAVVAVAVLVVGQLQADHQVAFWHWWYWSLHWPGGFDSSYQQNLWA